MYRPRPYLLHIYKCGSEDRIINILLGVSVLLIISLGECFTKIMLFIFPPFFRGEETEPSLFYNFQLTPYRLFPPSFSSTTSTLLGFVLSPYFTLSPACACLLCKFQPSFLWPGGKSPSRGFSSWNREIKFFLFVATTDIICNYQTGGFSPVLNHATSTQKLWKT